MINYFGKTSKCRIRQRITLQVNLVNFVILSRLYGPQLKRLGQNRIILKRSLTGVHPVNFADAVAVRHIWSLTVACEGNNFAKSFLDIDVCGDFLFCHHEAHWCVVVVGVLAVANAKDRTCWDQVAYEQCPYADFLFNFVCQWVGDFSEEVWVR